MVKRGIDISAHQGNIDLNSLKSQIDFVIIRVGYGVSGTIDTKFKRNADLCIELGIPFGFYWYSYALDENGAKKEADACINAIAPYKDSYSMGVWFDMEDADGYKRKNGMPSNATLRAICATFCKKVEEAGYYTGIYASQGWFNNQLNGSELDRYDKWIAQWPTSGGSQKALATDPNSRSGLSLWQFTSAARFSGYNGNLDCNYAYKDSYRVGGDSSSPAPSNPGKSTDQLAQEVINGLWGNGDDRKNRLQAAGYDYNAVQDKVNQILGGSQKPAKKSIDEIAKEVIAGQWGNGQDRVNRLQVAGYNYEEVQNKVNQLIGGGSKPSDSAVYYTVKPGDSLSSIAAKYGMNWRTIYNNNKATIGNNPNKIYVGQKLRIK